VNAALLVALITGLATGLGALPFVFVAELSRRTYDGVLGLGAGLMLAAATIGLLGEALEGVRGAAGLDALRLGLIAAGFIVGVATAMVMDRFIPHRHAGGHHQHLGHEPGHDAHDHAGELRRPFLILGAISIHRLPEGLAIGAGFASGHERVGWLLAVAIGLQNICEGMVMTAPLRGGGLGPGRSLLLVASTGLTIPLGALAGVALSSAAAVALPFMLALAAGTLIYVTSNEIIPESHSHGHEGTASFGVVAGFLTTMLLSAALH
jgi:ZIP family zinc transporter